MAFEYIKWETVELPDLNLEDYQDRYHYNFEEIWVILEPSLRNSVRKFESWLINIAYRASKLSGNELDKFIEDFKSIYKQQTYEPFYLVRNKGTFNISRIDFENKTFYIKGQKAKMFLKNSEFEIINSTGNNGNYKVNRSGLEGSETFITVDNFPEDPAIDGQLYLNESDDDFKIRIKDQLHIYWYKILRAKDQQRKILFEELNRIYRSQFALLATGEDLLELGKREKISKRPMETDEEFGKRIVSIKSSRISGSKIKAIRSFVKLAYDVDFGFDNYWFNAYPLGGSFIQDREPDLPIMLVSPNEAKYQRVFWFKPLCSLNLESIRQSIQNFLKIFMYASVFFVNDDASLYEFLSFYSAETPSFYYFRDEDFLKTTPYGYGLYGSGPYGGISVSIQNMFKSLIDIRSKAKDVLLIAYNGNIDYPIEEIEDCLNNKVGGHKYVLIINNRDEYIQNYFTDIVQIDDSVIPIVIDCPNGLCRTNYHHLLNKLRDRQFPEFEIRDKLWHICRSNIIGSFQILDGGEFFLTRCYNLPLINVVTNGIYIIIEIGSILSISESELYDLLYLEKPNYYEVVHED